MIRVTSVQPVGGFKLRLTFSDGTVGELDFGPELCGEMFTPLRDEQLLRRVRVDESLGTITWPNGADFDPEGLRAAVDVIPTLA